ncbi:succinylglutamate desuccinylase/aspartoacylase family protein [bacterium]|nr:succinylglutamate desuccinylase/aspartoacylase family protein [bacterium]
MAEIKKKFIDVNVKNIRPFKLPYWEIDSGKPGPCFLINAEQHGIEVIGCEVIRRFCPVAAEKILKGKFYLLPFSNPPALWNRRHHVYSEPGLPKGRRQDDMNRGWPGNPEGHEIEQIVYLIYEILVKEATHNIDMHCHSFFNIAYVRTNDDTDSVSLAMASAFPMVIIEKQVFDDQPTSLRKIFNRGGKPSFSTEFSGQYVVLEEQVKIGIRALENCSKHLGMFEGEPEGTEKSLVARDGVPAPVPVVAPFNGLFIENGWKPGDYIKKGDMLGTLFSDANLEIEEIRAPISGLLTKYGCSRRHSDVDLASRHPYADKGDILANIREVNNS